MLTNLWYDFIDIWYVLLSLFTCLLLDDMIKFYLKPRKPHNSSQNIIISVVIYGVNCKIDMFFSYKHTKAEGHHSHTSFYEKIFITIVSHLLCLCEKRHVVTWNVYIQNFPTKEYFVYFLSEWWSDEKKGLLCMNRVLYE